MVAVAVLAGGVAGGILLLALLAPSLVVDRFELLYTAGLLWVTAGVIADAFNHMNGAPVVFINAEHTVAYTGVLVVAAVIAAAVMHGWRQDGVLGAIPAGYRVTLLGPVLFAVGGAGDLLWHRAFGVEVRTIQMLSPTHIVLAGGAFVLVAGPIRHAYRTGVEPRWRDQLPLLTGCALLLSLGTFLFQMFHPFVLPVAASNFPLQPGAEWYAPLLSIAGMVLTAVLVTATVLTVADRFSPVRGAFTFVLGLNAVLMAVLRGHLVFAVAGLAAGAAADVLVQRLSPSRERLRAFRLVAAAVPTVMASAYFMLIAATAGIGWSVHVWTGTIAVAGIAGVMTSFIIQPFDDR